MNEYLLSELKKKSNNTDLIVELVLEDLSLIAISYFNKASQYPSN